MKISKYKDIFAKVYITYWSKEFFVIKSVKNRVSLKYIISDINNGKTAGTFYKTELQKANQAEFRVENLIKKKFDKLYIE